MEENYDIIVVGAGHAGCEAAAAAARMGCKTLLITMNLQTIGQMSCNPAMGGVAKGQIVREIDALGGYSGIISDMSMIQFRMLNRSKGPAMWSPRTQNDRMLFSTYWRESLENIENIFFWQDSVSKLIIKDDSIMGIETSMGYLVKASQVILTSGTFMNGIIHVGESNTSGGRVGEKVSFGLTEQLNTIGFESGRMKTGTPPRVDGRSLNYNKLEVQNGDEEIIGFSYTNIKKPEKQRCCWITYTNNTTHEILQEGFDKSPMYSGRIQGSGPRYCPSIEDKISRFSDKDRHQIFVEPEGWNTIEIYVNGFSTSLPLETQIEAIKTIPGFENCKIFRPGYAIEYDYFPPTQLKKTLEKKIIKGLFFAGQINGTTGYEEAACQGLIAGINAANKSKGREEFILDRSEAYIGVLIDDLITKGTDEPYRMFTSRAEYRILLRQDNADTRLMKKGHVLGLISNERYENMLTKIENINKIESILKNESAEPSDANEYLIQMGTSPINQKVKYEKIILRPQIGLTGLMSSSENLNNLLNTYSQEDIANSEIQIKYASYIEKEKELVEKMQGLTLLSLLHSFWLRNLPLSTYPRYLSRTSQFDKRVSRQSYESQLLRDASCLPPRAIRHPSSFFQFHLWEELSHR